MARRRKVDPKPTLFPFLSVLAVVMGTLILIIAGMTQLSLAAAKQRVEIEPFDPRMKTPIYVECRRDGLLIHPTDPTSRDDAAFVNRSAMGLVGSPWDELTTRLQYSSTHYLLLLVRPDGVGTFADARTMVSSTNIDLGYEPLFGDGDVRFELRRDRR